jgi:hypothetical protein
LLRTYFSRSYAGIDHAGAIRVHVMDDGRSDVIDAIARYRREHGGCPNVVVVGAEHSLAMLEALHRRFTARADELRDRGLRCSSWGVDITGNTFRVGLLDLEPENVGLVHEIVGTAAVTVMQQGSFRLL